VRTDSLRADGLNGSHSNYTECEAISRLFDTNNSKIL
jgi:hypothetical protein